MMIEWIRRIRNSWGYGVQSPSDFFFVQHVLREKSPYYAYSTIEEMIQEHSVHLPSYAVSTNRLLFRLANHVHPDTIVEVGAGLSVFAMAMACPSARCVAITSSDVHYQTMLSSFADCPQVMVKNGDEKALFSELLGSSGSVDMLHIAHTPYYREIVDAALPHVADHTLIVIEDIRASEEKHNWWKNLQESPLTGITYDLGSIGLLCFDKSRHKDAYWVNPID